jgi:hypothetical protein
MNHSAGKTQAQMNEPHRIVSAVIVIAVIFVGLIGGCSGEQTNREPTPALRIDLSAYGLPKGFFAADADTKCAGQVIGYRFVIWLSNQTLAVGFNTSPNCRVVPDRKVDGSARLLVFSVNGVFKAKRDIPYLADGNGEIVAQGEAKSGPSGTLLFRIESVNLDKEGRNESKSGVLLLDANLKDVVRLDHFLEQTTFVDHALVFQERFTLTGPRTYSVLDGAPPVETQRWTQDWPVGTMDRKFGDNALAYMLCQQELQPNTYTSSNIVYAGAKRKCMVIVEAKDQTGWAAPLKEEGTAAIIGLLADGSVAGQISVRGSNAGQIVIWKRDQTTETLPWIPRNYCGSVQSATSNMSRYATFATDNDRSDNGRWIVFDRRSQTPIVNRVFPRNGRATLSPDGLHYATFESGELRIYSLAKSESVSVSLKASAPAK